MANHKKIDKILSLSKQINLKAHYSSWGEKYLNGLHDYRIHISIDGREYSGIGIDEDEEIAFLKGFSEAVDRFFFEINNMKAGGIGTHWTKKESLESSISELIERDIFLGHYLSGTPGKKFVNSEVEKLNYQIRTKDRSVEVFELSKLNNYFTFLSVGKFKESGHIIGLGTSKDCKKALKKSMIECLFCLMADNEDSFNDLIMIPNTPKEHYNFHLRNNILNLSSFYINSIKKSKIANFKIESKEFKTKTWNVFEYFSGIEMYTTYSSSKRLQNMFFGKINEENINLRRIKEFNNKIVNLSCLEQVPHPMG
ncbi:MAG: YcaO-like family protein [Halobacteriovoraceae bacterium]|nr:YcaO-like family protein [Halobacteriovoraceae bacterium]